MSKFQLKNDKVVLTYDEDTKTLVSIKFIDKNADVIDLNKLDGIEQIETLTIDGFGPLWRFENIKPPRLILADNIKKIEPYFFRVSNFTDIVWPKNCHTIPKGCFMDSMIETLSGIDGVNEIDEEAFFGSNIRKLKWPKGCTEISAACFGNSALEEIGGLENVTVIGQEAFDDSKLKEITWPQKCGVIPKRCFADCENLHSINGLENVRAIKEYSFQNSGIERIDLSSSVCVIVEKFAFCNSKINEFIPGFYTTVEDGAFLETSIEKD